MGCFLVNFHVRAPLTKQAQKAVEKVVERGWVAKSGDNWFSFWDEEASQQSEERIEFLAERVSKALSAPAIAFLVHDSDILCYWLYDGGRQIDKYNSRPHYWGDETIDAVALQADCEALATACVRGTPVDVLEELLRQAEKGREFVFEEERLQKLGPLLGINQEVLMSDFGNIGIDVDPEEIGAVGIGDVETPKDDSDGSDDFTRKVASLNARAPLHAAATQVDLATIERLVSEGRDINKIPGGMVTSALAIASASQSPDFIRRMVELGADLHPTSKGGATPLRFAVQAGNLENARALIELGADVSDHNPYVGSLLHAAVIANSEELVRELLNAGVDPSRVNVANMTPLQAAEQQLNQFQQLKTTFGEAAMARMDPVIQKLTAVVRILKSN